MGRNNHFQFKQFRIEQQHSAMKVGMDGVLIGAWADVSDAVNILDIGAGTGLIALMMAQRNPVALIDAIEIDPLAFEECVFNMEQSAWNNRLKATCLSLQEYVKSAPQQYDLIVSNPPYFSNGIQSPDSSRSNARHDDLLPLEELIGGIACLLDQKGKAALIMPIESLDLLKRQAATNGLFLSRLCYVKPNPKKPVFRIMVELTPTEFDCRDEQLMIEYENHFDYTSEYRKLTREFYLKF